MDEIEEKTYSIESGKPAVPVYSHSSHAKYLDCPMRFKLSRDHQGIYMRDDQRGLMARISTFVHKTFEQMPKGLNFSSYDQIRDYVEYNCSKIYEEYNLDKIKIKEQQDKCLLGGNIYPFTRDTKIERAKALANFAITEMSQVPIQGETEKEIFTVYPIIHTMCPESTPMPIIGYVDYLPFGKQNKYEKIVDWKLTTSKPNPEYYKAQMGLYAYMLFHELDEPVTTELNYFYLDKDCPRRYIWSHSWSYEEVTQIMKQYSQTYLCILLGLFPANPNSPYHMSCPYRIFGQYEQISKEIPGNRICPYAEFGTKKEKESSGQINNNPGELVFS